MSKYFNPVEIIYTNNWLNELIDSQKNLGISHPILVTSPGNRRRLKLDSQFSSDSIFSNIGEFLSCSNSSFLEVKIQSGSRDDLGRPTKTPVENKVSFMKFLEH